MVYRAIRQVSCTARKRVVLLAVCLLLVACVLRAEAIEIFWDANGASPPDGIFNIPDNWNPDELPDGDDTAVFNLSNTYTVEFDNSPTTDAFKVNAGDVTFTNAWGTQTWFIKHNSIVDGGNLTLDGMTITKEGWSSCDLSVGYDGTGELTIEGGGRVESELGHVGNNSGSNGTVTVTGSGSTWDTNDLAVGHLGTGVLTIEQGGLVDNLWGYIGSSNTSTGTVTVTGSGSTWNSSGDLRIGSSGIGTLTVENGGKVESGQSCIGHWSGSIGTVTVTGSNSIWDNSGDLYVGGSDYGAGGNGTLTVQQGGTVNVAGTLKLWATGTVATGTVELLGSQINCGSFDNSCGGTFTHDDGTLTVDGGTFDPGPGDYSIDGAAGGDNPTLILKNGASATVNGNFVVGRNQAGTMNIQSGSTLSNNDGYIGREIDSNGTVIVKGTESTWDNLNNLHVGFYGTGKLTIEDGGQVENTYCDIGCLSDSNGTVIVTGSEAIWNNSSHLGVGMGGTGKLTIEDGGRVSNDGNGYIGYDSSSDGTVTVTGSVSIWDNSSNLYVGGSEHGVGGNGTLTVKQDGTVNVTGTLKLWHTGTVELLGSKINCGSFDNSAGGTFTHDDGTLTVDGGTFTFDSGPCDYSIDGAAGGDNPTLILKNCASATLGGSITVGNTQSGTMNIQSGSHHHHIEQRRLHRPRDRLQRHCDRYRRRLDVGQLIWPSCRLLWRRQVDYRRWWTS